MNTIKSMVLIPMLLVSSYSNADEVVQRVPDNSVGQVIGGWSSVLIGGVLGGPIGAIAGGLVGAWAGGGVQELSGTSGNSYLVKQENDEEVLIRSPNYTFQVGDKVKIVGLRAIPIETNEQ
jgi:outer membrane lipoprotein SlyB